MFERETKLLITRGPTAGEIYLQGYADGYHARPRVIQRTRKAQAAYTRGYDAGEETRKENHGQTKVKN